MYTNSYTATLIITGVLQIRVHNYITFRKDGIIMIMTIAIADIDASFHKNKWDKEEGIKE